MAFEDFDMDEFNDLMNGTADLEESGSIQADNILRDLLDKGELKFLDTNSTARIDANGHLIVTTGFPVEDVDFTEVQRNFSEGANGIDSDGYSKGFQKLGFDLSDADVQEGIREFNDSASKAPNAELTKAQDDLKQAGKKITDKIGTDKPANVEDLANKAEKAQKGAGDRIRQEAQEFQDATPTDDEVNDYQKNGDEESAFKRFKDWLCKPRTGVSGLAGKGLCFLLGNFFTLAFLALLAYTIKDFINFLDKVGDALSGCWSYINGNKSCKILPLTCSVNDRNTSTPSWFTIEGQNFAPCQACPDYPGSAQCGSSSSNNLWIPVLSSKMCACAGQQNFLAGYIGNDFGQNTTSANSCAPCTGSSGDRRGAPSSGNKSACPNAQGCIAWNEACDSGNQMNEDCSAWCDSSQVKTRPGQTIQCKQCNFGCALASTIGDIFGDVPSGLLDDIEKILLWCALGIVILVVGYVFLRIIMKMFGGGRRSDESSLRIEVAHADEK